MVCIYIAENIVFVVNLVFIALPLWLFGLKHLSGSTWASFIHCMQNTVRSGLWFAKFLLVMHYIFCERVINFVSKHTCSH
jgi:hypothetical protein